MRLHFTVLCNILSIKYDKIVCDHHYQFCAHQEEITIIEVVYLILIGEQLISEIGLMDLKYNVITLAYFVLRF